MVDVVMEVKEDSIIKESKMWVMDKSGFCKVMPPL